MLYSDNIKPKSVISFINDIQNVYNDRMHQVLVDLITEYLKGEDELFIGALYKVVLVRHPRQFKVAPGIHELEQYREEAKAWYEKAKPADYSVKALEDKSEYLPREAVAEKIGDWVEKITGKADV